MKLKLILVLCFAALLGGCSFFNEPTTDRLVVTANKLAAHPPATITIRADLPEQGWSFAFDTDVRTFRNGTNEVDITFYELPAVVTVTATKAGEKQTGDVFIDLINEPVNMDDRPFVASYGHVQGGTLPNAFKEALSPFDGLATPKHSSPSGDYFLSPLSYEVFLCERDAGEPFWPGDIPLDWGFYDPDGDDWHIVDVVAWYSAAGEGDADAVFASVPYKGEGFYEFKKHPNSFLIIPSWPQIVDVDTGILKAPTGGVSGYSSVGYCYENSAAKYPQQDYYVRITTEDSCGSRNTATFVYRLLPTGCW